MCADAPRAYGVHQEGRGVNQDNVQIGSLITVPFSSLHRTQDFVCAKSKRVAGFFEQECAYLHPQYCRVFIAPNPNDPTHILGYYTLAAGILNKQHQNNLDEKRASKLFHGYPAPVVRIGFMGRDDTAPKGFGSALLVDAARRVARNQDIAVWGLVLESEGGPDNPKLWKWYQDQGFKPCREQLSTMYSPLSSFLA
jgi:GNAT superfamily N-acetyltransferase